MSNLFEETELVPDRNELASLLGELNDGAASPSSVARPLSVEPATNGVVAAASGRASKFIILVAVIVFLMLLTVAFVAHKADLRTRKGQVALANLALQTWRQGFWHQKIGRADAADEAIDINREGGNLSLFLGGLQDQQ